MKNPLFSPVL
jgi:hypothetical protein